MDSSEVAKSPVVPANKKWDVKKRKGGYESDVTALVRSMLEDEALREDQKHAWERWRNDPANLK